MNESVYSACRLCPRNCGVNRREKNGYCGCGAQAHVSSYRLHLWEEPYISGKHGSGTVFFSGCPLRCVYCQNYKISRSCEGEAVTPEALADIFEKLAEAGAHNLNLVTPTQFTPSILAALDIYKSGGGRRLPVVWNCGGYESPETLEAVGEYVDIYLPDYKYALSETALEYSGAKDYPEVALAAIKQMLRQKSKFVFGEDGMLKSGVVVRHLVLPGAALESRLALKRLYESLGNNVLYSIMSQYTPTAGLVGHTELARKITESEYAEVVDYADEIGIENALVQEGEAASESFIPDFGEKFKSVSGN